MPPKDDLRELIWIFYGFVAAAVLIVGVVQLIENEHHTVGYWLVAASWLVTFATLAWGFRKRRGRRVPAAGNGLHLHVAPERDRALEVVGPSGENYRIENREASEVPPETSGGLGGTPAIGP
jgi:Na+/melibiose symporter-like transporter